MSPLPLASERLGHDVAGRYRVEKQLGQGGMGVLYEGRHLLTGRRVAIKFLLPRGDLRSVEVDRFLREARVAARLEHPNVVEILDMGLDGEQPYLVMELLRGESLAEELGRTGCLDPERAFQLLAPIMGALACAHDRGIVHRDLKPENIFLSQSPSQPLTPKLLDFGVASAADESSLTQSGMTVGTPSYMSPEQAKGELTLGAASDVWSMGVVWYRALSGRLPHEGTSSTAILVQIVTAAAPRLCSVRPELPALLGRAIDRALERRREDRYTDMRAFANALVRAGRQLGMALPVARDVPGLDDWGRWLAEGSEPALTAEPTRSLPAVPAYPDAAAEHAKADSLAAAPTPRSGTTRTAHGGGRSRRALLAALGLTLGLTVAFWLARELAVPAPVPAPREAPAGFVKASNHAPTGDAQLGLEDGVKPAGAERIPTADLPAAVGPPSAPGISGVPERPEPGPSTRDGALDAPGEESTPARKAMPAKSRRREPERMRSRSQPEPAEPDSERRRYEPALL